MKLFHVFVVLFLLLPIAYATPEETALDFVSKGGIFTVGRVPVSDVEFEVINSFDMGEEHLILIKVSKQGKKAFLLAAVFQGRVEKLILLRKTLLENNPMMF